jgi:hypothetical protein
MATYYIAATGNDSTGTGTVGNPWLTLSKAVSASASGDTINVAAGAIIWRDQTTTTPRTLVGAGAGLTIFDSTANVNAGKVVWELQNWTISGITFQNAICYGNGVFQIFSTNAFVTFNSCIFKNFSTSSGSTGLYNAYGGAVGTFNFTACLWYGALAFATTDGVFLASSTIVANLTNCTWYQNAAAAATFCITRGGTTTVNLINSIVWNANGVNHAWNTGSTETDTGTNNDILGFTGAPALANQIASDPLFVDLANGNFNLRPSSPCIDAGTPI